MTLARVSCASATQTLAWAAATISGRASESRKAVARLIGKPTSFGCSGALLSLANGSPACAGAADNGAVDCFSGRKAGAKLIGKRGSAGSRAATSSRSSSAGDARMGDRGSVGSSVASIRSGGAKSLPGRGGGIDVAGWVES